MATVVSITNPITGAVEQVDKLDHTAQQIDDAVALAPRLSNPNLLDNWYFANPVNQRGQTSYTGAGYGIDRWYLFNNITCRITSDGLTLVSNGENSILECYLDTDLTGKTVTMSALIDGIVYSGSKTVDQHDFTDAVSFPGGTIRVFYSGGKTVFRLWLSNVSGTTVQLKAVKLELGSQQTLAHQDADGNWVLNEIPDYGEQLRRCQRYFVNFNPYKMPWFVMPPAVAVNTSQAYSAVTLPVSMRAQPVVSYGGNIVLSQSADHAVTSILVSDNTFTGNSIKLRYDISAGTLTANSLYRVQGQGDTTSYIWLSADL